MLFQFRDMHIRYVLVHVWVLVAVCHGGFASEPEEAVAVAITRVDGVPTFAIDHKPFLSPAFETYVPTEHYFQQFAAAGTRLFSFNTNAAACDYGHSAPINVESGVWDYSQFDERASQVLAANPDALLIPRINLGTPRWWLEAHPEALERFEEGIDRPIALGAFYGYMYEFLGDPEFGHNALGHYLDQEELDFIFVTASYFNREFATGADYPRSPWTSVQLHGKVWYHDNDVASFLAPKVLRLDQPGNEDHPIRGMLPLLGYTDTPARTKWMYQRAMGFALGHGFYTSFFDLHGGYFDHPELLDEVARLNRLAEAAAERDRSSVAEILVVADEVSCAYVTPGNPLLQYSLQAPQLALMQLGAPVDQILLEDLERANVERYKLVVFLNCFYISEAQRAIIGQALMRDHKTLLWCYAPGYLSERGRSLVAIEHLTGIGVGHEANPGWPPLQLAFTEEGGGLGSLLAQAHPGVAGPSVCNVDGFYVDDNEALALAHSPESDRVVMAMKDRGDWTSIYSPTPNLPAVVYRALAEHAGVHLYNEADDTLYVSASYLTLHAKEAGERTLRFPTKVDLFDPVDEALIVSGARSYTLRVARGETVMLRWSQSSDNESF